MNPKHGYKCTNCGRRRACLIPFCTGDKCIPKCERCARLKPPPKPTPKMRTIKSYGKAWTPTLSLQRRGSVKDDDDVVIDTLAHEYAKVFCQVTPTKAISVQLRVLDIHNNYGVEVHGDDMLVIEPNVGNMVTVRLRRQSTGEDRED